MKNNKTIKIFITEEKEIAQEALLLLEQKGYTLIFPETKNSVQDIQGLFVRTYTRVTKAYLEQFPNLQFILRAGVGLDNIDVDECKKRNISIFNAPGANTNAVAEYLLTVMLLFLRNVTQQMEQLNKGEWRERTYIGQELQGKIIGLVGCGNIGKLLAKKLQNFDVTILGYDPYITKEALAEVGIEKCELSDLIKTADIVSLQLPLTPETKDMFGMKTFSQMKKNSLFINISRGELVIEEDLIEALKKNIIAGAVLDVFRNEPDINKKLFDVPNLLLTPHIAGFTKEADSKIATYAVRNFLEKWKGGEKS